MNQEGYREILLKHLYPWINETFEGRCYVHQDNDPKHRSRLCLDTLFEYGINAVCFIL